MTETPAGQSLSGSDHHLDALCDSKKNPSSIKGQNSGSMLYRGKILTRMVSESAH